LERAVAAICVTDPSQIEDAPEDIVARRHGLTPAEAKVAVAITSGQSARQIAEALGISYHTLRTHLKHIFAKTNTRRQGELIRLILRHSSRVRSNGESG
jgi:DNA-binding CsgD family transcriptional regulator